MGNFTNLKKETAMETVIKLQAGNQKLIKGMEEYIKKLKAQPQEIAEKEAREALIRTGVTQKDGTAKDAIVS